MKLLGWLIPWWVYVAAGAIALAAAAYGGWKVRDWRCDAALAEVLKQAEKDRALMQAQVESAATDYEGERADATVDHTIREREVREIYRDIAVPADCAVPDAARRVLEGAIDRANSRAAGEPSAAVPGAPAPAPAAE